MASISTDNNEHVKINISRHQTGSDLYKGTYLCQYSMQDIKPVLQALFEHSKRRHVFMQSLNIPSHFSERLQRVWEARNQANVDV